MAIIVQKYGGSSVADVDKLHAVAQSVAKRVAAGDRIVVVVSAMGKTTDQLLAQAALVTQNPPQRELDMLVTAGERISMALLSMAMHKAGVNSISFTGSQSGIITENSHQGARIIEVRPYRIQEALEAGKVVIV
ncbi:MAG: aspartate kinase, partial [Deltaproteobacteria bacterium]|nr:aspartate kinase [Deltaproteobacteria bacterium]